MEGHNGHLIPAEGAVRNWYFEPEPYNLDVMCKEYIWSCHQGITRRACQYFDRVLPTRESQTTSQYVIITIDEDPEMLKVLFDFMYLATYKSNVSPKPEEDDLGPDYFIRLPGSNTYIKAVDFPVRYSLNYVQKYGKYEYDNEVSVFYRLQIPAPPQRVLSVEKRLQRAVQRSVDYREVSSDISFHCKVWLLAQRLGYPALQAHAIDRLRFTLQLPWNPKYFMEGVEFAYRQPHATSVKLRAAFAGYLATHKDQILGDPVTREISVVFMEVPEFLLDVRALPLFGPAPGWDAPDLCALCLKDVGECTCRHGPFNQLEVEVMRNAWYDFQNESSTEEHTEEDATSVEADATSEEGETNWAGEDSTSEQEDA